MAKKSAHKPIHKELCNLEEFKIPGSVTIYKHVNHSWKDKTGEGFGSPSSGALRLLSLRQFHMPAALPDPGLIPQAALQRSCTAAVLH